MLAKTITRSKSFAPKPKTPNKSILNIPKITDRNSLFSPSLDDLSNSFNTFLYNSILQTDHNPWLQKPFNNQKSINKEPKKLDAKISDSESSSDEENFIFKIEDIGPKTSNLQTFITLFLNTDVNLGDLESEAETVKKHHETEELIFDMEDLLEIINLTEQSEVPDDIAQAKDLPQDQFLLGEEIGFEE